MNGNTPCELIGELTFVCVALSMFLIGSLIILFLFWKSNKDHQNKLMELGRYSTNVQVSIDKSITTLLHDIIDDCFEDYQIMVLVPKNELYITDEREKEIRSDLVQKVVDRLSPMALDKLSLFYNIHKIDEVIADKVYITVMNYVVSHNALIEQEAKQNTMDMREH